jgi:hypothetical protein
MEAKGLIMPSRTESYGPVSLAPSNREPTIDPIKVGRQRNRSVANSELNAIQTIWSHLAGGANPSDVVFTSEKIQELSQ